MANALDPRLVRIGIEVNGETRYYSDLNIEASGTKYANATENECEVKITNLSKEVRDYLLTETSPFLKSKEPKKFILEAGRESTGLSTVYIGDIVKVTVSQPPDITLTISSKTQSTAKGDVVSRSAGESASLSSIAQGVASDLGTSLKFEADDKQISNYSFTGGKSKQVDALGQSGNVNAYIDDDNLIVKNANSTLKGATRILNLETGMIGIPEIDEHGIKVKYLYDNVSVIGGALIVESILNPSASGTYEIYKLSFDIANRNTPFYWTAEAKRL